MVTEVTGLFLQVAEQPVLEVFFIGLAELEPPVNHPCKLVGGGGVGLGGAEPAL